MTGQDDASSVLLQLWDRIGARQWDRLSELLDPKLQVRYVHTGEDLDVAAFLRANSDYPGRWRVTVEEVVGAGDRAVSRTRVFNDEQSFYVASFARTSGGLIAELVEIWTETGLPPHPSRTS
jgi:SnoaL-like domain